MEHHPLPSDDPTQRQPDITKAKELLGWVPTVELPEGLTATVEYFRRQLSADRWLTHQSTGQAAY